MLNYNGLSEQELLERIAANDRGAANYIYDKYSSAIYGLILQKIKHTEACEEILVTTFVSFFQKKSKKSGFITNSIFIDLYKIARRGIKNCNALYVSHRSLNILDTNYFLQRKRG